MHVYAIAILQNSDIVKIVYNLTMFGWFQRTSIKEIIQFLITTVIFNSKVSPSVLIHDNYKLTILNDKVVISDTSYPNRIIFSMLNNITIDNMDDIITKGYQDDITILEKNLEETKMVIHETISSLLERGEKIEDLVQKSELLSQQSKTFYKYSNQTKKNCCNYM